MQSIRTIVAATDFSEHAGIAIARAARLAQETAANLELLHVLDASALLALREVFPSMTDAQIRLVADAQEDLRTLTAQLGQTLRRDVSASVRVGTVMDELVAASERADLLVLGARGTNPLHDLLLGTSAERLLRKSLRPVLMVKRPAEHPYRQAIVPVDFSAASLEAIQVAMQLAPAARITLVHAFDLPFEGKLWLAGIDQAEIERHRSGARDHAMDKLSALVRAPEAGGQWFDCVVRHGHPQRVIVALEEELQADLIVLGKRGKSSVEEWVLGSVTRHTLANARCDVAIVHG